MKSERTEKEQAIARVQLLKELSTFATSTADLYKGHRTWYYPFYLGSPSGSWGWLVQGRSKWRPKTLRRIQALGQFDSSALGLMPFCISLAGIDYLLRVSSNEYEFWKYIVNVCERYVGQIEGASKHNELHRTLSVDAKVDRTAIKTLQQIPKLPIPLKSVRSALEGWHSFGHCAEHDLPARLNGKMLTADLAKDLLPAELVQLAAAGIVITDRTAVMLHPLAVAILKKDKRQFHRQRKRGRT